MTPKDEALTHLANVVKSDFKRLDDATIIGRIMLFSGRDFNRSNAGYQLLKDKKLIEESFITQATNGSLSKMISKNAAIAELIDRLDLVPTGYTKTKFEGFTRPKPVKVTIEFTEHWVTGEI